MPSCPQHGKSQRSINSSSTSPMRNGKREWGKEGESIRSLLRTVNMDGGRSRTTRRSRRTAVRRGSRAIIAATTAAGTVANGRSGALGVRGDVGRRAREAAIDQPAPSRVLRFIGCGSRDIGSTSYGGERMRTVGLTNLYKTKTKGASPRWGGAFILFVARG